MECHVCGAPANSTCGSCNLTPYCCTDHQKKDWKSHKAICFPYKIVTDDTKNRNGIKSDKKTLEVDRDPDKTVTQTTCMAATRDIKAGIILWEEPAAFFGPLGVTVGKKLYWLQNLSLCLCCGADLQVLQDLGAAYKCSRCSWPLCGKACEENPTHAANECRLFSNPKHPLPPSSSCATQTFASVFELFTLITIIRGAGLKRENPKVFQDLMKLFDSNDLSGLRSAEDASNILERLRALGLNSNPDFEIGAQVCKILFQLIQVYGFVSYYNAWGDNSNPIEKTKFQQQCNMSVYPKASYLTHSCVPNCTWTIGPPPRYPLRVMTALPIKKGAKVTISRAFYPGKHSEGTSERQKCLIHRGIHCACARCADPTELQTFSSAITCKLCRKIQNKENISRPLGYVLPVDPINRLPDALWQCSNEKCANQQESFEIDQIVGRIKSEILSLQSRPNGNKGAKVQNKNNRSKSRIQNEEKVHQDQLVEDFFTKVANMGKPGHQNLLHPNHWVLVEPTRTLAIGENILEIAVPHSLSGCKASIERIERCLDIETKICPGISFGRALIQTKLTGILCASLTEFSSSMTPEEIQNNLKRVFQVGNDALKYFKNDFPLPQDKTNYIARYLTLSLEAVSKRFAHLL